MLTPEDIQKINELINNHPKLSQIESGLKDLTSDNEYTNLSIISKPTVFERQVTTRSFVHEPLELTDGANIASDWLQGNRFTVTLGGNRTLSNPTNAKDQQTVIYELIQDGTGNRTITLDSKFVLGDTIPLVTLSTTGGDKDYLGVLYNEASDEFYVIGFVKGF